MRLDNIFNRYTSSENVPFYMISKNVTFPEDKKLEIYGTYFNSEDIPWTIVSYNIYGTIEHWWILSSLNKQDKFYASADSVVKYILPSQINDVISKINR